MTIYEYSAGVEFAMGCIAILGADFTDETSAKSLLKRGIMPLIGILEKNAMAVGDSTFDLWLSGMRLDEALATRRGVNREIVASDDAVEVVDRWLRYSYVLERLNDALRKKKLLGFDASEKFRDDIAEIATSSWNFDSWSSVSERLKYIDMVFSLLRKNMSEKSLPKLYAPISRALGDVIYIMCVNIINALDEYFSHCAKADVMFANVYNQALVSLDMVRDLRKEAVPDGG